MQFHGLGHALAGSGCGASAPPGGDLSDAGHAPGLSSPVARKGLGGDACSMADPQSASHLGLSQDPSDWAGSLLNAIGEGVCIAARDGAILWTNEVLRSWPSSILNRISSLCREHAASLIPRNAPANMTPRSLPPLSLDGRDYEVSLSPVAVPQADGTAPPAPDHIAVAVRDVSAFHLLRRKLDAIDRAGSEMVRMDAENVRKLNAHERLKHLETKIVRVAHDLLHFDHFAIRLLDDKTGKLELVMGSGLPPEFDLFDIYPRLEGCGISGYVAATGRSYVAQDVSKDELFLPGVTGARSSLTVPLLLSEKIIGIMDVESLQPSAFGEEERQLGEMFARYVALALHMLDLLVVERSAVNRSVSERVTDELQEPLRDIQQIVAMLQAKAGNDTDEIESLSRIRRDVESIQERVKACAAGPTTLLGVEKALADSTTDPLLKGKQVLVADDEPKIRHIIADVLRHRGCEVTVCENGAIAIQILNERHEKGVQFDLVISDIRMPDRNGYEVFSAARRVMGMVPVILMTGFGYDPHHSIVRASQEGLQAVLFKPFQVERLLDEVKKALQPPVQS